MQIFIEDKQQQQTHNSMQDSYFCYEVKVSILLGIENHKFITI